MAQHRRQFEQDRTDPAEAFLKYVGVAGIALTALLTLGLVGGLVLLLVPTNEAVGTVVFTALLLVVVYGLGRYNQVEER